MDQFTRERLEASGLEASADILGILSFEPGGASRFGVQDPRAGFAIPYYDKHGQPTGFHRLRFKTVAPGAPKYLQPPDTGVHIYFPPNMPGGTWQVILSNATYHLTITEGELKAACAAVHGIPTLALGGVSSFAGPDAPLHPDLESVSWQGRQVDLVFDSDIVEKPQVASALRRLAALLVDRGAIVRRVTLPAPPGDKVGLDDYLVAHGVEAYNMLPREAPSPLLQRLEEYRERWAVCNSGTGKLVVFDALNPTRAPLSASSWKEYVSNHKVEMVQPNGRTKTVYPGKEYLEWTHRLDIEGVQYIPGQPRFVDGMLNTWMGRPLEPWPEPVVIDDVQHWIDLMRFLFNDDSERIRWFEQWCAYPLQNPGSKMYSAVFMYSPAKGLGKTLVGTTLMRIYGSGNVSNPSAQSFGGSFNGWAEKEFVFVDELGTGDRRMIGSNVRGVITSPYVRINEKYRAEVEVPSRCNVMLCSNHGDSIEIDHDERRFFVHKIKASQPLPRDFYQQYQREYLGDNLKVYTDGLRKLYRYLLDVSLDGFDPQGPALKTYDLESAIESSQTDIEHWLDEVATNPDAFAEAWRMPGCDLFLASHFRHEYQKKGVRFSNRQLIAELNDHPFIVTAGCEGDSKRRVVTCRGRYRVYAIRNQDHWAMASTHEVIEHFDAYHKNPDGAKL